MTTITRRTALTGMAATPVVATLPLAAFPAEAKDGYTPFAYPEYARSLWARYIDTMKAWVDAVGAHDDADEQVKYDIAELEHPWLHRGTHWTFEARKDTLSGEVHTLRKVEVGGVVPCPTTPAGNWAVLEYRPMLAVRFPDRGYLDGCKTRWQPYTAEGPAEALELSRASGERAWQSFCGKVGNIHKKRRVKALARQCEEAWECVADVSQEIAEAPCDGAVMLAVKLALGAMHRFPTGTVTIETREDVEDMECLALLSAYKTAVACGGFDPIEQYRATPGI